MERNWIVDMRLDFDPVEQADIDLAMKAFSDIWTVYGQSLWRGILIVTSGQTDEDHRTDFKSKLWNKFYTTINNVVAPLARWPYPASWPADWRSYWAPRDPFAAMNAAIGWKLGQVGNWIYDSAIACDLNPSTLNVPWEFPYGPNKLQLEIRVHAEWREAH